jgi:H+-transporting ATPase
MEMSGMDHNGLSTGEAESRREEYGFNEIQDNSKQWYELLWDQVYGDHWYPNPIPGMMWIAIIVCLIIEDWADGGVVFFLHAFNSSLGFYETMKAGDAVAALKNALAPVCNCKRNGEWKRLAARELVPGDLIMLKIGDVVPADGILQADSGGKATCDLDQSGLTGESLPVKKVPGDTCYSGTVVKRGEQDMLVTHTGEKTEMGKGVALIQSVDDKGQVEVIMNRITLFLVIFAISMNILLVIVEVIVPSTINVCSDQKYVIQGCFTSNNAFSAETSKILSNFVVLMVAAIPIATPVVVTATMAIGARKMAQQKAVVTKLSAIEELAGMTVLCSDKTGTLTKNVLTIDAPYMMPGFDWETMIFYSALAAKAVDPDAIDKVIRNYVRDTQPQTDLDSYEEIDFIPFDPMIKRTEATMKSKKDGTIIRVTKGAPQVICEMSKDPAAIREQVDQGMVDFASKGLRPVGTAVYKDGAWHFMGMMSLFDPPRDDSQLVIERALKLGSSVKMITGDHLLIAKETCRRLGMGDAIMGTETLQLPEDRLLGMIEDVDGFAEVMPEDKFNIVSNFQKLGHITGMTGDGVNDAPALRKANVGFAVEGATAAAQGAADCILLSEGLSVIITAIIRSRKIFQRLQNYLIYRVFMSVYLLCFFFIAIAWADFDFPPLLIILMCLILDLSTMSLAYDKVVPSALPNRWNLTKIIGVAIVMGVVATLGSLLFLSFMRNNTFGMGVWQRGMSVDCGYPQLKLNGGMDLSDTDNIPWADQSRPVTISGGEKDDNGCESNTFNFASVGQRPMINYPMAGSYARLQCCVADGKPGCDSPYKSIHDLPQACAGQEWSPYVKNYYEPGADTVPHVGWPLGYDADTAGQSMLGYSTESGDDALFDPRTFPYSSAVENTVMFLQLCLTTQLAVLSARVDGWFFIRRPGYVLLSIITTEMICTTIVAAAMRTYPFWYPNSNVDTIRMTAIDGKYIAASWLFAILLFLVMECAKWTVYKMIEINRTNELAATKRMKLKEELRRRMSRRTPGFRAASISAGGLAPRSTSMASRGGAVVTPRAQGDELNEPLLTDNYAG